MVLPGNGKNDGSGTEQDMIVRWMRGLDFVRFLSCLSMRFKETHLDTHRPCVGALPMLNVPGLLPTTTIPTRLLHRLDVYIDSTSTSTRHRLTRSYRN